MSFDENSTIVIVQAEDDIIPKTTAGEHLGSWSTSLWIQEDGREFPIFTHNEGGCWNSPIVGVEHGVETQEVSEEFIESVVALTDTERNSWLGVPEDLWEEMTDAEQYITCSVREAIRRQDIQPNSPQLVFYEMCKERLENSGEDNE